MTSRPMDAREMRKRFSRLIKDGWRIECRKDGMDALLDEIGAPCDDLHRRQGLNIVLKMKHANQAKVMFGSNGKPGVGQPTPSRLVYFGPVDMELPKSLLMRAYGSSAAVSAKRSGARV